MADAYSSFQSVLEENAVTVMAADAWLKSDSGFRVQVTTFEQGLRANPRDYDSHELPAIAVEVSGGDVDAGGTLDTVEEEAVLGIYVIVQEADFKTRRTLAMDIGARVKRVARGEVGSAAWNNVATDIPGDVGAEIETEVSGPVVDDLGEGADSSFSNVAVATVVARVTTSIDDDLT
mgnify:CR=1 FL=1